VHRLSPTSTLFPYTTLFRSFQIVRNDDARAAPDPFQRGDRRLDHVFHLLGVGGHHGGEVAVSQRGDEQFAGHHLSARTVDVVPLDRKSTRLNSSHVKISYAV